MPLSSVDFIPGLDFTGLPVVDGSSHNQLVQLAVPFGDNATEGKGLALRTIDSALDTPSVPDPLAGADYTKWKRYIWVRLPHATSITQIPKLYVWIDAAVNNTTYLKWVDVSADITIINQAIDDLNSQIQSAFDTANQALATANAANTTANTALSNVNTALDLANQANALAADAIQRVEALETTVAGFATDIVQAQNDAAAALAASTGTVNVSRLSLPGSAGQRIRSNDLNTAAEWYTEPSNYCKITEQYPQGTNAPTTSLGIQTYIRAINTIDYGNLVTLPGGGKFQFLKAGIYKLNIKVCIATTSEDDGSGKARLLKDVGDIVTLVGTPVRTSAGQGNRYSFIDGVITVAANDVFKIDTTGNFTSDVGLGQAANIGGVEQYVVCEITRLQ